CETATLRCRYDGRRFGLDGRMHHAPEFEGAFDFPSQRDRLPVLPLALFGPLALTSLAPAFAAEELLQPLRARLTGVVAVDVMALDPESVRDYDVDANWMLYVDNYLEGLHIPFVHPALAQALDYGAYRTE